MSRFSKAAYFFRKCRNGFFLVFIALFSGFFVLGCESVPKSIEARDIANERMFLEQKIQDFLQILTFAARNRCFDEPARECLEAIQKIVGEPDPSEANLACNLDDESLHFLCREAIKARHRAAQLNVHVKKMYVSQIINDMDAQSMRTIKSFVTWGGICLFFLIVACKMLLKR